MSWKLRSNEIFYDLNNITVECACYSSLYLVFIALTCAWVCFRLMTSETLMLIKASSALWAFKFLNLWRFLRYFNIKNFLLFLNCFSYLFNFLCQEFRLFEFYWLFLFYLLFLFFWFELSLSFDRSFFFKNNIVLLASQGTLRLNR